MVVLNKWEINSNLYLKKSAFLAAVGCMFFETLHTDKHKEYETKMCTKLFFIISVYSRKQPNNTSPYQY